MIELLQPYGSHPSCGEIKVPFILAPRCMKADFQKGY